MRSDESPVSISVLWYTKVLTVNNITRSLALPPVQIRRNSELTRALTRI